MEDDNEEVYRVMLLGKISTKLIDPITDERIFQLDPDQTPEEERINILKI